MMTFRTMWVKEVGVGLPPIGRQLGRGWISYITEGPYDRDVTGGRAGPERATTSTPKRKVGELQKPVWAEAGTLPQPKAEGCRAS